MSKHPANVFVNVPFDDAYAGLFEALVFTTTACGYRVRCALEENDAGDIRMDKLVRLIAESPRSIHDLSRTQIGNGGLPRFNMPFELGMAMGAKRFNRRKFGAHGLSIMVAEPFKLPAYLSDLGGNDPAAHHNEPSKLIEIVRDFLHSAPDGRLLEGPRRFVEAYGHFRSKLPEIAEGVGFTADEVGGFQRYRVFLWCVSEFLKGADE